MNGALRTGIAIVISTMALSAFACGEDAPPDVEFAPRLELLAPIDEAELITVGKESPVYQLRVVSGLPNACAKYKNTTVKIVGADIVVDVRNTVPQDDRVICAAVYGSYERTVDLPGLKPETDYTVTVNDQVQLKLKTEAILKTLASLGIDAGMEHAQATSTHPWRACTRLAGIADVA